MKRDDIKKLVIVKLEEHSPFGPLDNQSGPLLSGGNDLKEVKPIYSYIDASIVEAGNEMLRIAPLNKLIPEQWIPNHVHPNPMRPHTGHFELPDDFIRLHTLLMFGWRRPVHRAIMPEDDDFHDQDYEATAGNCWKPTATIDGTNIYYYSLPYGCHHKVEEFLYVPDYLHTFEFTDAVGELIALNCARKVYDVFGNTEGSSIMAKEIATKLENLKV